VKRKKDQKQRGAVRNPGRALHPRGPKVVRKVPFGESGLVPQGKKTKKNERPEKGWLGEGKKGAPTCGVVQKNYGEGVQKKRGWVKADILEKGGGKGTGGMEDWFKDWYEVGKLPTMESRTFGAPKVL